jgi:hypothetical protein
MNSQITGLRVASVVFGLMAIAQLVRLVIRPEVLVAGHPMPLWPSVPACIILGGLARRPNERTWNRHACLAADAAKSAAPLQATVGLQKA